MTTFKVWVRNVGTNAGKATSTNNWGHLGPSNDGENQSELPRWGKSVESAVGTSEVDGAVLHYPSIKMETGLDGPKDSLASLLHGAQEGSMLCASCTSSWLRSGDVHRVESGLNGMQEQQFNRRGDLAIFVC